MSRVEVQLICSRWVLLAVFPEYTFVLCTSRKLIDILDTASSLQMHISNSDELPLKQYYLVS